MISTCQNQKWPLLLRKTASPPHRFIVVVPFLRAQRPFLLIFFKTIILRIMVFCNYGGFGPLYGCMLGINFIVGILTGMSLNQKRAPLSHFVRFCLHCIYLIYDIKYHSKTSFVDTYGRFASLLGFRCQCDLEHPTMQRSEAKSCTPVTLWANSLFCIAMNDFVSFQLIFSFVYTYGCFGLFLDCLSAASEASSSLDQKSTTSSNLITNAIV